MVVPAAGPPGQPDIAYTPDWEKYQARVQHRQETEDLPKTLPAGFPSNLESTLAWDGATVADDFQWSYQLSTQDLAEVHQALQHFKGLGEPLGAISQETFPLQTLHGRLRDISREIHSGHGFTVVRGVPVDKYTREENVIIYAGISSHVATIRGRQDNSWFGKPADVVLAHVKDLSGNENDSKLIGSPAYTTEKQVFHTDAGDVIALFALGEAEEGGESYLASSWTVYNELAKTRPDLIHTLSEPWANDEFGKTGPPGYTARPLLYHQPPTSSTPERVIIQYARRTFVGYWSLPRTPTIPAITEAQAEALDALHYTAEKHALALQFKAGDIQFVNNLSVFHARLGFRDSATKKRHLVRLWLRDEENAWDTPEELKTRWARVYDGVQEEKQVFPLEATVRSASKATIKPEAITPDVKHIAVGA